MLLLPNLCLPFSKCTSLNANIILPSNFNWVSKFIFGMQMNWSAGVSECDAGAGFKAISNEIIRCNNACRVNLISFICNVSHRITWNIMSYHFNWKEYTHTRTQFATDVSYASNVCNVHRRSPDWMRQMVIARAIVSGSFSGAQCLEYAQITINWCQHWVYCVPGATMQHYKKTTPSLLRPLKCAHLCCIVVAILDWSNF